MDALSASEPAGLASLHTRRTYCRLCEAQCGLVAEIEQGKIIKIGPDRDHPVSSGFMCAKAPGMLNVTYDPDRVTTPMRRCGGPGEFEPVTWDEALDDIAARLRRQIAADGGQGIGLYMGNPPTFGTMHFVYAPAFLRLLGGTRFFNALHVDTGAKNLACSLVYGSEYNMTFPDLERCDLLLMLGANPAVSHMSLTNSVRSWPSPGVVISAASVPPGVVPDMVGSPPILERCRRSIASAGGGAPP